MVAITRQNRLESQKKPRVQGKEGGMRARAIVMDGNDCIRHKHCMTCE